MASRAVAVQASIPTDFVIGKRRLFFLGSRTGNEPSTLHSIDLSLASTAGTRTASCLTLQRMAPASLRVLAVLLTD